MGLKNILVYADEGADHHLELAAKLAKAHGATLTACHIVIPLEPSVYGASGMFGAVADKHLHLMKQKAESWKLKVESVAKKQDVSIHWRLLEGSLIDSLKDELFFYDLFITGPDVVSMSAPITGGALLASGCPALILPQYWKIQEVGENILATWKKSASSNRALRAALPLFRKANKVEVICVVKPSAESEKAADHLEHIQQWLTANTISSSCNVIPKIKESTSHAIQAYYEDSGADLLVMGCYGHRRLFEWVFGGVTQDLLVKLPMPILITH